ncbi:hypothetical protein TSAR_002680 [Trichomalopsis sarcophagae]|uniref:Tudor domain-containing protein n=1 Tax=Trichomalopsis sarcophagae TaxID=543379 RepID=A0A232EWW3_9HYME|nr:hypothetical protein TSAR_002680 [Trichomalopsis sarcophagae]
MVVENEQFVFVVTHVEAEGQFLKIWAQTDERVVQSVASMLTPLQEKLDYSGASNFLSPNNVQPHTRCCAKGISKEWARAKILNLRSDGMILLQFVDYGNIIYVPIHNIRLLDNMPEANYLFAVPEAATPFVLADVIPIGGSWMDEIVNKIRCILINNKYHGVYQTVNNYKALKFDMMSKDFSRTLIERNMALYSPSCPSNMQQMMPAISVQPLRTPHSANNMHQENWRTSVPQNVAPVQKVVKTNSFKAIQLEIGSVHDVRISYVEEGPCKFSVQLLESIPYLNTLMEKINSQSHLPLQEPPIAGTVCLGRQNHNNRLCRVVLNSPGDTSCKVYYADYGHHEVLQFSNIYQIPDEFVIPNIFSIRFTLSGIINWTVTPEMKDYFGGLVSNENLKLRVCKGPMSPLTQYCELYLRGKNIKDMLSETFPDSCEFVYNEPKRLQEGTKEMVFVSFVQSVTKFFIQIERDLKFLDDVMDRIELISKTAAKVNPAKIHPEMPCIALYDLDKKWYRASIIGMTDNDKARVFYVDYGNEEIVSVQNLRVIPADLVRVLPKQAIRCSLNGFKPAGPLDKEFTKTFENLVIEERLCLIVLNNLPNTVIVDLFEGQNASNNLSTQDIAAKLKALEISTKPENVIPTDRQIDRSVEPRTLQSRNQKSDAKAQAPSTQKQKIKNKNTKTRDNGTARWEKETNQAQFSKPNSFEPYDTSKSKFRKDNENEQRNDNRFRKGSSEYSNGSQSNRFDKELAKPDRFSQNDRFGNKSNDTHRPTGSINDRLNRNRNINFENNDFRAGKVGKENSDSRPSINSRLDRSFNSDKAGSDKDSDTSSRSGGRRSNRGARRSTEDSRKRDAPANNRNRIGRWESEEREVSLKNYNGDTSLSPAKSRSPRDNHVRDNFDKSKSSEWDASSKLSTSCSKDSSRYMTSTPISKIPPPNITIGAVKNCVLVYYTNPVNFYVHLLPDIKDLNLIMEKIASIYEDGGKVLQQSEIRPDLQCIAQYAEDQQWYRAIVKSVEATSATVHFIDYGNDETISFDKIKEIEPEFLKLPAQAVHCKLFCPSKSTYTKEESDKFADTADGLELESEFVSEENGIYQVLLGEPNSKNVGSAKFINNMFADGQDLIKEKEAARNKSRTIMQTERSTPNYATLDEKWSENKLDLGIRYPVLMGWFINPESFYCQLADMQKEFRDMMNEIQNVYAKRQPVSGQLKVGSSVIAVLPEDGVLYRAQVLELNKPRGHVVQYIDYGDRAMVDPRNIYPVERKYMKLPKQAIFCALKNIAPTPGSNWSNTAELAKLFGAEKFDCIFHELKNDKYLISLSSNGIDIGSALVDKNVAVFSTAIDKQTESLPEETVAVPEELRMDINLLEGQTLHVRVSSVEGVAKFYVQLYTAVACQSAIDNYMASKDPQVMPRLLCHEVCLGAGCLVNCRGKWRRGVVINFTKSNYEVRLIDTGEHETISLKSMLGLPGQLALMQNQAIECALFDVPLSSKADNSLKKLVTGKDVKIFVEKVERNRLIVRLFDINGTKIKVFDTQNTERISPVCSMQILGSRHEVNVSCIRNSNNIWLQRTAETSTEKQLSKSLTDHYSTTNDQIIPKENEVYAGLCTNGSWNRVQVTKLNGNTCTVTRIDNGHVQDISIDKLRALDAKFYLPHQLAIRVSLPVSLTGSDVEQINILEPLLVNKVLTATFFNVNRKWVVELSENGEKLSEKLSSLNIVKETKKTRFDHVELPGMVVGQKYEVIVAHSLSPKQVWLQRAEELDAILDMQDQLQEASTDYPDYDGIPEEKALCLAMYSLDDLWYRAEVLDADEEITTVRFIDYGNTDVIHNNVSKIKQLPDKWKAIKKYAIECKLDVLPVNADDWSDEASAKLSELVTTEDPIHALIIADKAPMRIDLYRKGDSICKMLIDEKLATYVQSSEDLNEEIVEEVQLDPRSAFVSNIISVDQFWVQEEKWINDLEMIEDRLVMAPMFPQVPEIEEGLICIAHFPDDNLYYRAIILSHTDEGTKVRYIDYGNSAITKDLKTIPEDLAQIRPLSRKCCLVKPDGIEQWPDGIHDEFVTLAASGATVFLLDVIEESETCLVKLTCKDKDVAMELIEQCSNRSDPEAKATEVTEEIKVAKVSNENKIVDTEAIQNEVIKNVKDIITVERPPPIGEENSEKELVCTISYVNSPADFWVQNKEHFTDLDNMIDQLVNAENYDSIKEIKEGRIVAAKFDEDEQWYRSKILYHSETGTEVFYIDYGNSAVAKSDSSLRELPGELAQIPPLSVQCSLKLPDGLESWSRNACEKFCDLAADGVTEFKFEILDENNQKSTNQPLIISLIYKDQDVAEILANHEKTLQSVTESVENEKVEFELRKPKDIDSTGDSAIQSMQSEIEETTFEIERTTVQVLHDTRLCNSSSMGNSSKNEATDVSKLNKDTELKADELN